jgi:CRISPR-associated protein Csb2
MLAIEVAFLTGRYVATAFDDRSRAEWPPHPARLFSALVAALFESLEPNEDPSEVERAALLWLEGQGAPEIAASEAAVREVVTVFVPVNDTSVLGSFEDQATAVDEARDDVAKAKNERGKGLPAAEKKLAKAELKLKEAVRQAIAPVTEGKEGKEGPAKAASMLPERRVRQPRTFPSVRPEELRAVFTWPAAEPSDVQCAALDAVAARVVRLGHSSSLVAVRLRDDHPEASWIPDEAAPANGGEEMLRVAGVGQLEALRTVFHRQGGVPGRVMPASFQRYVHPAVASSTPVPHTVFSDEWIVLRRVGGPRFPSTRAVEVARRVRDALLTSYGTDAPEILSGHRASGPPSERPHLACVPLPFVGHERADGSILGIALVLPRSATREERIAVYRALDAWGRKAPAGEDELPRFRVELGRGGVLLLARVEEGTTPSTLLAETWCANRVSRGNRSAGETSWATATPIALDRNPGELRANDPQKEAAAYAEAEKSIAIASERIGLPRPAQVTVLPAAPLAGADKARQFPPFLAGKPPVQRVLVHAALTFDMPVQGPILVGAGRYFGLGLFRPLRDHG